MGLFSARAMAFALILACAGIGGASAQQEPENIPWENSMAIARKMAIGLLDRQSGSKGLPLTLFAIETDLPPARVSGEVGDRLLTNNWPQAIGSSP